jgi:N6-adenosine-specific RNA methylase IME4
LKYRTIVADPPWHYPGFVSFPGKRKGRNAEGKQGGQLRVERDLPYDSMSVDAICALPVPEWADRDCALWLWTTSRYLADGFRVLDEWGFRYCQTLVWHKHIAAPALGGSVAPNHAEYILLGKRGQPTMGRLPSSVIQAPGNSGNKAGAHSRKPEVFLDLIEEVSPAPRLEMFARRARLAGWHYWGNEALQTAEVVA